MRIVFFGSSEFGLATLERLSSDGHSIEAVVTVPDRPQGRGLLVSESPVGRYAREQGISLVLKPEVVGDRAVIDTLRELRADIFIVIAYRILPASVFSIPPLGAINLHASLLPRYRGAAPIQRAIENGESETGVTVFRIEEGIDTGGILWQVSTRIGERETAPELSERLSRLGADAVSEVLKALAEGRITPRAQDESLACRAPRLRKEEGHMDWSLPAKKLFNRVRAFKPFPGTYTFVNARRLGIEWAEVIEDESRREYGVVEETGPDGIKVRCGQGALLITRVRPEGRGTMDAAAFLRGNHLPPGTRLE